MRNIAHLSSCHATFRGAVPRRAAASCFTAFTLSVVPHEAATAKGGGKKKKRRGKQAPYRARARKAAAGRAPREGLAEDGAGDEAGEAE